MSDVLTPTPPVTRSPAEIAADQIRADVRSLAEDIARRWRGSFGRLWQPQAGLTSNEILEALGTDGARVFELSNAIVTMLMTVCQTRPDIIEGIEARIAMIPPFEIGQDGTVSLADVFPVPPPPPEPEPEEGEEIELEEAD